MEFEMMGPADPVSMDAMGGLGLIDERHLRAETIKALRATRDDAEMLEIMRYLITRWHGIWTEPPAQPTDALRPATHLFEIHLFGQSATGATPEQATRNWLTAAENSLSGEPTAGRAA
jgi:hypothetical protein